MSNNKYALNTLYIQDLINDAYDTMADQEGWCSTDRDCFSDYVNVSTNNGFVYITFEYPEGSKGLESGISEYQYGSESQYRSKVLAAMRRDGLVVKETDKYKVVLITE